MVIQLTKKHLRNCEQTLLTHVCLLKVQLLFTKAHLLLMFRDENGEKRTLVMRETGVVTHDTLVRASSPRRDHPAQEKPNEGKNHTSGLCLNQSRNQW